LLNDFAVYKARISKRDELIDDQGNKGRWHLYWVYATDNQIETLSGQIKKGWYAHFWSGQKLLAVSLVRSSSFEPKTSQRGGKLPNTENVSKSLKNN